MHINASDFRTSSPVSLFCIWSLPLEAHCDGETDKYISKLLRAGFKTCIAAVSALLGRRFWLWMYGPQSGFDRSGNEMTRLWKSSIPGLAEAYPWQGGPWRGSSRRRNRRGPGARYRGWICQWGSGDFILKQWEAGERSTTSHSLRAVLGHAIWVAQIFKTEKTEELSCFR